MITSRVEQRKSNTSAMVFFAGGGTGGHLYPGLAIARALVKISAARPFFIGAKRGIERDILPTAEFSYQLLDLHPLYRKSVWNNWRTARGSISAMHALNEIARNGAPRFVLGTGGYASAIALLWARLRGIPTVLHEPDSHPGLTTKLFARGASAVLLGFPEAASKLRTNSNTKVLPLGCPIEPPPHRKPGREEARALWNLPADAFVVLVTGGSQGAKAINDVVAKWCKQRLPDNVAVIWATGRANAEQYLELEADMVRVRSYLAPISEAYAAADIAITRAGAVTIAELCAWEIPSILIPLPTAAQDHQTYNARVTAASGAAVFLPQEELSAESLNATVLELYQNSIARESMRAAAFRRARPSAANDIANVLLEYLD